MRIIKYIVIIIIDESKRLEEMREKSRKKKRSDITIAVYNDVMNASSQGFRARKDGPLCITSNRIICLLLTNDSNEEAHLYADFH